MLHFSPMRARNYLEHDVATGVAELWRACRVGHHPVCGVFVSSCLGSVGSKQPSAGMGVLPATCTAFRGTQSAACGCACIESIV
jgi:hypothetical protein